MEYDKNKREQSPFQSALADFTYEMASGAAIRHLADLGYTVKEISESLSYPTPLSRIQKQTWDRLVETGVILLQEPGTPRETSEFVKVYDQYGRASFRKVVQRETGQGISRLKNPEQENFSPRNPSQQNTEAKTPSVYKNAGIPGRENTFARKKISNSERETTITCEKAGTPDRETTIAYGKTRTSEREASIAYGKTRAPERETAIAYGKTRVLERETAIAWKRVSIYTQDKKQLSALLRDKIAGNGAENSYAACNFGLLAVKDPTKYKELLAALDKPNREYVEGLPWERGLGYAESHPASMPEYPDPTSKSPSQIYHKLNDRMQGILFQLLEAGLWQGDCYFLGTEERLCFEP